MEARLPRRIHITDFEAGDVHTTDAERRIRERARRTVVAVVPGECLVALYARADVLP